MTIASLGQPQIGYPINPNTQMGEDQTPSITAPTRSKRGVAPNKSLWPQNSTVTISFQDTPEHIKKQVKKHVAEIGEHVNLKFKFVESGQGDIRISAHKDIKGNWSEVGTDARDLPKDQPTMHIDPRANEPHLGTAIQHEFLHALGVDHEQQHPDRTVPYDKPKTYDYYRETNDWDEKKVDLNVLDKYDPADVITTPYDRSSIMHYSVPGKITTTGESIDKNSTLSEGDIAFLKSLYPPAPTTSSINQNSHFGRKGLH
ncbi:hypothetical protein BLL37_14410 [Pseudomonas azotoformans]|uniref:Peptidase metallopeptidase domain-containing protein n=1 Tax=Pseudomonas azotoformans TaxID=47878 RepID=A0A1V2JIL2_PSEAZ|nr:M12 family metallopeptidase [Pseudomonas azotoformans]OIN46065.1 hypothetical protein BFL39_20365 [Pseudomonas azotoformans]ONH44521.1 hypothetical protein BLL37_14410 [Pseudomonas azotoformans]SDN24978.1 Astacin (Peptidase family M12A) [Pseudomonas azotoformans]